MISLRQQLADALDAALDAARRNNLKAVNQYRALADRLAEHIQQEKTA
jgi:hypothetical protein